MPPRTVGRRGQAYENRQKWLDYNCLSYIIDYENKLNRKLMLFCGSGKISLHIKKEYLGNDNSLKSKKNMILVLLIQIGLINLVN